MESYRVEKRAVQQIQLPDQNAEIEPVPATGGGQAAQPELDRLSNILQQFNGLFGATNWTDADRVFRRITEEIPAKVAADPAYRNAIKNTPENAQIEHDRALARVMMGLIKDDTQLFKEFSDNPDFRRWLAETVFRLTSEKVA